MTPTKPQTIVLLVLSRGGQLPYLPPMTGGILLRARWIAPVAKREPGSKAKRLYVITEAGQRALATSPSIAEAQRELDRNEQMRSVRP